MNYSALALSAEDLKLGVGEALGLFLNDLGETTKIVVANVEAPGFETIFRPSLIVPAGPVKLGVTAVIDPEALNKLSDPDKDSIFPKVKRPDEVLAGVLAELEPKSDYQVLMVQGPPALAKRLAEAYPGFDIVVATSEYDDVLKHDAEMLNGGKTMLVSVGRKGKYVGVFGLYPKETERLRYQVVTLDKKYDGPATAMKELIEDEYRDTLQAGRGRRELRAARLCQRRARRDLRRRRELQVLPPQHLREVGHDRSTPRPSTRWRAIPSRTRSMMRNASPATRPGSNTTRAGAPRPRRPTWRATSARTATGRGRSTSPSPTTPSSAS